jgi:hypothetical protein
MYICILDHRRLFGDIFTLATTNSISSTSSAFCRHAAGRKAVGEGDPLTRTDL